MKKNGKNVSQNSDRGMNKLLEGYTEALENNSLNIVKALEQLKSKKLSDKEKKAITRMGKELEELNKDLDSLGFYQGWE